MIHLASLAQPAIPWKIEAHLWFYLWGHFQREITQGRKLILNVVSASHKLGDWTEQKERHSWHSFLSASWLCGMSCLASHGLKSLRPGTQVNLPPLSCFCQMWSQWWNATLLFPWSLKELKYHITLITLFYICLSFRNLGFERDGEPDDPFCALLCLQWATKRERCNQLRMNPPMLLSGWASQVTQVPWALRTFWLCFYTIQPCWPRATVSTEKGGPARGWSGGIQNTKQAMLAPLLAVYLYLYIVYFSGRDPEKISPLLGKP